MGVEFKWRSDGAQIVHTTPQAPWTSRPLRRRLLAVGLIVVALAGAIDWQAQRGLAAARADLERTVAGEVLALQTGRMDLLLAALDSTYVSWVSYHEDNFRREAAWFAARPAARPHVEGLRLHQDRAQAEVVLADGTGEWRSTWFFEREDGAWRHAPPPSEYWGAAAEFNTDHVSLVALGPDRRSGATLAAELEALYGELTGIYRPAEGDGDLSYVDGEGRASGRAAPRSGGNLHSFPYGGSSFAADSFPSPQLALEMWTPQERAAALARSARLALARTALAQALGRFRPAAGDWWLCEALAMWHARAWQPDWLPTVRASLAAGAFSSYLDVQTYGAEPTIPSQAGRPDLDPASLQPLAYTLGEYLGMSYSAQQLGALVHAVDAGSSWTALEDVLGLTRASLEACWGAFLQEHYGD